MPYDTAFPMKGSKWNTVGGSFLFRGSACRSRLTTTRVPKASSIQTRKLSSPAMISSSGLQSKPK